MKKMGIAVLAGAFVLVSVATGYAGVGRQNFNIQARNIQQNQIQARNEMYARTGRPQMVSDWKWERTSARPFRSLKSPVLRRVPANR